VNDKTRAAATEFPGFYSCHLDADGEPNIGITVYLEGKNTWLGWDDTVALHKWLGELIEVSGNREATGTAVFRHPVTQENVEVDIRTGRIVGPCQRSVSST
jgi:hypothetical protein